MLRRIALNLAILLFAANSICSANAENYPARPVRIIVAFSAGGSVDTLARIIADKLSQKWRRQVFVENRTGALGNIGAVAAARAPADGYTLHLAASSIAINPTLAPVPNFDPIKDFEPIMLVASAQDILTVPPTSPFHTTKELIDYAKAHPGELTYGTLGTSSSGNMAMGVFCEENGRLKMKQIAYSQTSQLTTDLIAGRLDAFFPTTGAHVGNVASGREGALGVSGKARAEQLPNTSTFSEQGVNYPDATSWYAIFAPKGTPKALISQINIDLTGVLSLPDVISLEKKLGFATIGGPPSVLRTYLKSEIIHWTKIASDPLFVGK